MKVTAVFSISNAGFDSARNALSDVTVLPGYQRANGGRINHAMLVVFLRRQSRDFHLPHFQNGTKVASSVPMF
jgi:hypothetical protein